MSTGSICWRWLIVMSGWVWTRWGIPEPDFSLLYPMGGIRLFGEVASP
jgi:hypothetical protein